MYRSIISRLLILSFFTASAIFMVSCGNRDPNAPLPELSSGSVAATANPLVAQYTISPAQAASVYVEFGTDTRYALQTSAQQTPSGGGKVSILVAGMKQNTTYHMRAVINYSNGAVQYDTDHTFTTGAIPAN